MDCRSMTRPFLTSFVAYLVCNPQRQMEIETLGGEECFGILNRLTCRIVRDAGVAQASFTLWYLQQLCFTRVGYAALDRLFGDVWRESLGQHQRV